MKPKNDREALLQDVFAESAPTGLREAMLGESLRLVHRRKRLRRIQGVAGFTVALGLVVFLMWPRVSRESNSASNTTPQSARQSYTLVLSHPLPATAIITTHPLNTEQLPPTPPVQIVQTKPGNFRIINDAELLSLVSPRPCLLVQTGPNSEELVFANPNDARGFLLP